MKKKGYYYSAIDLEFEGIIGQYTVGIFQKLRGKK